MGERAELETRVHELEAECSAVEARRASVERARRENMAPAFSVARDDVARLLSQLTEFRRITAQSDAERRAVERNRYFYALRTLVGVTGWGAVLGSLAPISNVVAAAVTAAVTSAAFSWLGKRRV